MVYSTANCLLHRQRHTACRPAPPATSKEPMKEISPALRSFILTLPSVPFLEALLLLHGAPGQIWTAEAIAQRLYLQSIRQADAIVRELGARGFCACTPGGHVIYQPADPALHALIAELSREYQHRLIEITKLVHG
jgi:hypothetical protein